MSNEYYKNLPKKRMASGALFFNDKGELLLVKPSYKDCWSIPGGVVDENESPKQACIREIKEEIGLEIGKLDFFCVDYMPGIEIKTEFLQFIFIGGILSQKQIDKIKIDNEEISEFIFANKDFAIQSVSKGLKKRLLLYYSQDKNKQSYYLENSQ